jgi:hypothetical protein
VLRILVLASAIIILSKQKKNSRKSLETQEEESFSSVPSATLSTVGNGWKTISWVIHQAYAISTSRILTLLLEGQEL